MTLRRLLLPQDVDSAVLPLLVGRALRAFSDGYVAVLLPAYLLALGFGQFDVGLFATVTLAGSALATLGVGAAGHRWAQRTLLLGAALLMFATGLGFASITSFWPLLVVAFVGTINPGAGDVSVFLPLEHAKLALAASGDARTSLFARYSLTASLMNAVGALASGVPTWLLRYAEVPLLTGMRAMFVLYALIGAFIWLLYRRLPRVNGAAGGNTARNTARNAVPDTAPLGPSRGIVCRLAALFSVDAFAGGLVVNSLMTLWLFERFGLSLPQAGVFFFFTSLLSAFSQLAAPVVARRIGLLNTMVFTHIPANVFLILAAVAPTLPLALAALFARAALSQMDVPTRTAFVMRVVTPPERAAAAGFTAVPRSLAAAASPALAGALLGAGLSGLPLIVAGGMKIVYDLAILAAFRRLEPPAESE